MRTADLHLHTHASSEASFDPEEVFSIAKARGLTVLTFNDHDSIASNAAGQRLADIYDVAFLPGVEITSSWGGKPAHVLGFFPIGSLPALEDFLADNILSVRKKFAMAMLEYLLGQGTAVTIAEYEAEAQEFSEPTPLYRLLRNKGIASNMAAFMALRESSGIRVLQTSLPEAIHACHAAGGIAVLAHPGHDTGVVITFDEEKGAALATAGLNHVEVFHPGHTRDQEQEYARIADRLGLVKTGGSDMHIPRPEPQKMVGGTYCDWDEVLQYLQR